jgi:hypothetical protein
LLRFSWVFLGFLGFSSSELVPPKHQKSRSVTTLAQRGRTWRPFDDGKSSWQVQVRRQGRQFSRTFRLRADAELWARQLAAELDRGGLPTDSRRLRAHTLADLLRRYEAEVVPRKRSADREVYMLRVILRHPVARVSLNLLTSTEIAKYRDHRLSLVKGDTVRRELAIVRHCIEVARNEWGFVLSSNPVQQVKMPRAGNPREAEGAPRRIGKTARGLQSLKLPLASCRYPTGRRDRDATQRATCDVVGWCGP